jgi:hypothetical protein
MEIAGDSEDYIVDVYCSSGLSKISEPDAASSHSQAKVVCVPGLKFSSDAISGEIVDIELVDTFAYDSDWSDLGDDEDPDSNDERYAGNDYPDDMPLSDDDDEEEEDHYAAGNSGTRRHGSDTEEYNLEEEDDDEYPEDLYYDLGESDWGYRAPGIANGQSRRVKTKNTKVVREKAAKSGRGSKKTATSAVAPQEQAGMDISADTAIDERTSSEFAPSESIALSMLSVGARRLAHAADSVSGGVGAVMHPFTKDDPMAPVNRKHGALKELWAGAENELGMSTEAPKANRAHEERVQQMSERLGLEPFESNVHEFDERGLPKYGAELSDDEVDLQYMKQANYMQDGEDVMDGTAATECEQLKKIPKTFLPTLHSTVAYDSELDRSSPDDIFPAKS